MKPQNYLLEVITIKKMAKIKNLIDELNYENDDMLDDTYRYSEWQMTEEYADVVNDELMNLKPIYSTMDIIDSITYAVSSVQIPKMEIGNEVYSKLLVEKAFEYLKKSYE